MKLQKNENDAHLNTLNLLVELCEWVLVGKVNLKAFIVPF